MLSTFDLHPLSGFPLRFHVNLGYLLDNSNSLANLSTYPLALTPKGYAPYMYMSGTSMATPHVSAAAALVLARKPSCTPDQVEQKLESTAIRLGGTTRNNSFGWGLIDPAKAVATLAC
jgi:subtilisin family serine protease